MIKLLHVIIQRYRLLMLIVIVLIATIVAPWRFMARAEENEVSPPAEVIVDQAVIIDKQVSINWLEGQPGDYPISGYIIERSRDGAPFSVIGHAVAGSLKYLDAEGSANDAYRVVAEDDRQPSNKSVPSETVVASQEKPGEAIQQVATVEASAPMDTSHPSPDQSSADANVNTLLNLADQSTAALDSAVSSNSESVTTGLLDSLQTYNAQILSELPQLSTQQRTLLTDSCSQRSGLLEADVHVLPESELMDGLIALAGCEAIGGGR